MQTLIQSKKNSEIRDYSQKIIENVWIERNPASFVETEDVFNQIENCLSTAKQTICILAHSLCLNEESKRKLTNLIITKQANTKDTRVYLLTDKIDNWGAALNGKALLRETSVSEGVIILTDAQTEKRSGVFCSHLTETKFQFYFELDNEQTLCLYRYFCFLFWKNAQRERLKEEILKVVPPPFGLSFPEWDKNIFSESGTQGERKFDFIFYPFSSKLFFEVKQKLFAKKEFLPNENENCISDKCEIFANDMPSLAFSLLLGEVLSYIKFGEAYLKLNEPQTQSAQSWLDARLQAAPLKWSRQATREQLLDKIFYAPKALDKKLSIEKNKKEDLPSISLNLNSVGISQADLNQKPEEKNFRDDGFSLATEYHWEVCPPILPKGAKEHLLYQEWKTFNKNSEEYQKEINKFLKNLIIYSDFNEWRISAEKELNKRIKILEETPETKEDEANKQERLDSIKEAESLLLKLKKLQRPKKLPETGKLYQHDGKNYLVICYWEELTDAHNEVKTYDNANIVIR